jgi:hypothetical protein
MYPGRSPPGIQSETSSRGSVVAPSTGTMFGCFKCFDIAATSWKIYRAREDLGLGWVQRGEHTSLTSCGSPPGYALMRLMRTFEPLKVPSYTHPRRVSEIVHDSGSTPLTPHTFLSSRSDSRNGALARSDTSRTTYPGDERGWKRATWCLTLSRYSTSHDKLSPRSLSKTFLYSLPWRRLLSCSWNCGEVLSRLRSCCKGSGGVMTGWSENLGEWVDCGRP